MIKIITVGKLKEQYLKEAFNEYTKRLSKYTKINFIELEDSPLDNEINIEGEKILKNINDKDFVVTLDIEGKNLTSLELSNSVDKWLQSNLTFVIGGSNGLSDSVKRRSNYSLSFSTLTFPHQLFRIIFLEQLYRSFKIINNEHYHK